MSDPIKRMLEASEALKKGLTSTQVSKFSMEQYLRENGNRDNFEVVEDNSVRHGDPRVVRAHKIVMPWEQPVQKSAHLVRCIGCGYMHPADEPCKCTQSNGLTWSND